MDWFDWLKQSEKTQITLLVTWLTELYLNHLGLLESDEGKNGVFQETRDEFRKFLSSSKHKECLYNNRTTIYDLLASHGNVDDMVYFSVIMQVSYDAIYPGLGSISFQY